jgi:hypothetical protein
VHLKFFTSAPGETTALEILRDEGMQPLRPTANSEPPAQAELARTFVLLEQTGEGFHYAFTDGALYYGHVTKESAIRAPKCRKL